VSEPLVIFGTGAFAECARFYFDHDSPYGVVAFTVHGDHLSESTFAGLPVVPFESLAETHPPSAHRMFVAVGYRKMNRIRAAVYSQAREKGYELVTYVSSKASHRGNTEIGENCFVFEDNTIQPFVKIGDDVVLWSGNHIGHHSTIGDHCFITSQVVVSGGVRVGDYSFLGVNATIRDGIEIGRSNLIGAGAIIMRSTQDREVYVPARTRADERKSDEIDF
jgi:sugar O-acyltransferase (sialic acid O-acetyltransferase NeuD family)